MTQDSGKAKKSTQTDTAPRARKAGLFVRRMGDELLVYDLTKHKAHNLNATAAKIWRMCDGKRSIAEIAERIAGHDEGGVQGEQLVLHALEQLSRSRLLQQSVFPSSQAGALSRRQFIRKAAVVGGVSVAAAVVSTIVAPTPTQATTCKATSNKANGCDCSSSGVCASGCCGKGGCPHGECVTGSGSSCCM